MTSIHQVILDGRLSQLNLLINRVGCSVNEKDAYGRTPLHLAVLSDHENYGQRVVRLLLQGKADLNAPDSQQQTPFVYACLLNRSKLIPLFLRTKPIDWHLVDYQGYTVLHHAASSLQTSLLADIVTESNAAGLLINQKTDLGYTPLILAIKSFRFDNALYLLDHTDASPSVVDDEYHYTCRQWVYSVGPKSNDWTSYSHRPTSMRNKPKILDKNTPNYKCFHGLQSPYQCKRLLCNHHHMKSLEESTYTPAILSPRSEDRKTLSSSASIPTEKVHSKPSYQMWMQLVQRLHDRTALSTGGNNSFISGKDLRREKSWTCSEKISAWRNEQLNSNKQVITLINHYSTMLTADHNERLSARFNERPKSILRPKGSPSKYRFNKEVTFATNSLNDDFAEKK